MEVACLDLEGVLVPEVWINVAERTGIEALRITTRDMPDYDALMKQRLHILKSHKLGLPDIQAVIDQMTPLDGAKEFLAWLRERYQVVILSDTFYEFAAPFLRKLQYPVLFCHKLKVDSTGTIVDYCLRMKEQKRESVKALRALNFKVIAVGDSYNDTSMLGVADIGILFRPPPNVVNEFPHFSVTRTYQELSQAFGEASKRLNTGQHEAL